MDIINKAENKVLPYTYLLKFKIENKIIYYYGVRYGNVKLNLSPIDDLFKKYFTSSKYVAKLLSDNIFPFEIVIHKVFLKKCDACKFEVNFLKKLNIRKRSDFLNQVDHFDNSLPNNLGRKRTKKERQKISLASKKRQSSDEYRLKRSLHLKNKWKTDEYKEYMEQKNNLFWSSERGRELKKKVSSNWIGKKHKIETKLKMSKSAKEHCKKIDCSQRARNRKKYKCPICENKLIDSSNIDRHLIKTHFFNEKMLKDYKTNYSFS